MAYTVLNCVFKCITHAEGTDAESVAKIISMCCYFGILWIQERQCDACCTVTTYNTSRKNYTWRFKQKKKLI